MYSAVQDDNMVETVGGVMIPGAIGPLVLFAERLPTRRAQAQATWMGGGMLLVPVSADDAFGHVLNRAESGQTPVTHVVVGEFDSPETAIDFVLRLVAVGFDGDLVALTWPGADREDLMLAGCNRRYDRAAFLANPARLSAC